MAEAPRGEDEASRAVRAGAPLATVLSELPSELSERLSTSQLRVLETVAGAGQTTPSHLVEALDALPSSVTRLCDRLVAAGQLERIRAQDDRRVQVLRLTRQSRALLRDLQRHRSAAVAEVLGRMTGDDRHALLQGLEAFAAVRASSVREEPEVG